jgi:hypothetical protein
MKIPSSLKDEFPKTVGFSWLFLVGVGFATLAQVTPDTQNELKLGLIYISFTAVGMVILIAFTEGLSKLKPRVFKPLLNVLLFIPKLLQKLYIAILVFLLKPAISKVIENEKAKNLQYTLKRTVNDDDFVDEILDFENLRSLVIQFRPVTNGYWRFGIKFSSTQNFSHTRVEKNFPLWHLAKNDSGNNMWRTYWNENYEHTGDVNVISDYDGSKLSIAIDKKDGLRVVVKDIKGKELLSEKFSLDYHRYGQITAWGDQHDYRISAEIDKRWEKNK